MLGNLFFCFPYNYLAEHALILFLDKLVSHLCLISGNLIFLLLILEISEFSHNFSSSSDSAKTFILFYLRELLSLDGANIESEDISKLLLSL